MYYYSCIFSNLGIQRVVIAGVVVETGDRDLVGPSPPGDCLTPLPTPAALQQVVLFVVLVHPAMILMDLAGRHKVQGGIWLVQGFFPHFGQILEKKHCQNYTYKV